MITNILMCLIPSLIYLGILFLTTPYKSWNFSRGLSYMNAGIISVPILIMISLIFPFWQELYLFPSDSLVQILLKSFVQIAFLEEFFKYLFFIIFRKKIMPTVDKQHPLAIMIYSGAVALGFAIAENLLYVIQYGHEVLYWRAFSAVVLHLCCGLMIGYFISLSIHKYKVTTNPIKSISGRSIMDVFMTKSIRLRNFIYLMTGLFMATFFHGLYDFNLISVHSYGGTFTDGNLSYSIQLVILTVAIYIVRKMIMHLVKLNRSQIIFN